MYAILILIAVTAATAAPEKSVLKQPVKPMPPGMVQVQVGTLHCPSCAKQIARNLYKTPGVKRVKTDMKKNQIWITVQPDKPVDLARLWKATKLKDVQPKALLVGKRRFVGKDFGEGEEVAEEKMAPVRR